MAAPAHELVETTEPLPFWLYIHHSDGNPPTGRIPAHWHRGIELSYTISGSINDFEISGQHFRTKPGQILLVNTQEIHSVDSTAEVGDSALSIIIPYNYLTRLFPHMSEYEFIINDYDALTNNQKLAYHDLQSQFSLIVHTWREKENPYRYLQVMAAFDQIVLLLIRNFTQKRTRHERKIGRKVYAVDRIQDIADYVSNHYQEKIDLEEIAKHCSISKEYLARFFKQNMGITLGQYVDQVRAHHAKELFDTGHLSLSQIAWESGFSGLRTMNRAFTKLYGKNASQMQKEQKDKR